MSDLYPNLFKNLTRNPLSIILLDGRKQTMVYDKTTKLSTLFEETCALCNLDSDNLFGFATLMDDYYAFLNLDTKVCKINFKEISKKSQNNVLFQSDFTYFSPIHKNIEDTRRLSQGNRRATDNNKFMQSTSSTKSAPVAFFPETVTSDKGDTPVIYFRIKSYVFPHCLRDKTTKSLYFLQLLRNVLDYKLRCVDEIYLQLGSYAIQAFYGDYSFILSSSFDGHHSVTSTNTEYSDFSYSPTLARLSRISKLHFNFTPNEVQSGRYFEPKKFFPSWIIEKYTPDYLFKEIPQLHKGLHGMSRVESEFSYIRMASAQYSNFNMHLFPVRDQKMLGSNLTFMKMSVVSGKGNGITMTKSKLWLGLSPAGLEMHQMKQSFLEHLSTLKWSDIDEVTHKSSRINIHVGCRNLKLNTNTNMQADHLFWLTRHMHMYQTKARLNATCTEEALESAERLKYHEKYVYMDLDDLKLHGLHSTEVVNQSDTTSLRDLVKKPSSARLPFANTPAALPRRTPSKAKPLKNKDLMTIISSSNESSNVSPVSSINGEKHRQYIKKSRQNNQTNTYVPIINKGLKSPEIALKSDLDLLYNEDSSKVESDQNTSNVYDLLDDSSITSSINESDSKSLPIFVVKQPGRFVSLSRNRNQEDNLSQYSDSPEHGSMSFLPPPQEFRESVNIKIVKSNSFDTSDIFRQNLKVVSQRHQSDPLINCVELSEHLLLSSNLRQDLYNPHATDDVRLTNISRKKSKDKYANSAGMKSWKSDVLFNLNTCLDDEDADGVYDSSLDEFRDLNSINDRLNSLPRRLGSFRDMINFSSSSDSDNDFESVDISSISSYEVKDVVYTRLNISTQVAII